MSSFMVGSVRIYGWSELTIPSHRCCLWHWVYHMSGFTTNWFLKLLGYIYICHYHYPHDISTYYDTYIYKYQYLKIYIYTHTPQNKNKRKHVEQISITAVWSSQITVPSEAIACAACTGCKGASKATATSPLSVTTSAGPWGFPQHQQMCKN